MIFEYRMKQNLFYNWSDKLLPGFFSVDNLMDAGAVDHLGRRVVRGPADVPLEAVAMLTMALPIAVVGIIGTQRWRNRILYALAICVLVAAMFATYRKSALIAPVSVILTLLYFRRRELLKLAPLGMVLLIIVSSISPGAIGSTISQFTRSDRATVPTVNDRASDYDAVRPDVWTHLAFGRGWGSYNHDSYRILDSEILTRTIEGGVIGLVAFLMVGLTVVACTRKTIAARDPASAPVALVGASIAIGFLVLATLFDELSFPHAPYIFLYMVGLVAVAIERRGARAAPDEWAEDALPELYDYEAIEEREPEGALVAQAPLVPMR
jgi:O-antigen ligase